MVFVTMKNLKSTAGKFIILIARSFSIFKTYYFLDSIQFSSDSYHFTSVMYLKPGANLKFPIIWVFRNQFHAYISSLDCRHNDPYIDNNEGHG